MCKINAALRELNGGERRQRQMWIRDSCSSHTGQHGTLKHQSVPDVFRDALDAHMVPFDHKRVQNHAVSPKLRRHIEHPVVFWHHGVRPVGFGVQAEVLCSSGLHFFVSNFVSCVLFVFVCFVCVCVCLCLFVLVFLRFVVSNVGLCVLFVVVFVCCCLVAAFNLSVLHI